MAEVAEDFGDSVDDEVQNLRDRVSAIVGRLEKEAESRVGKRRTVEQRWLADLAQYHGRYTESLVKEFEEARKSTLYINSTRPKTNAMASRLSDMLFPTDDKNWAIKPTPVPELTVQAEEAARAAASTTADATENPNDEQAQLKMQAAVSASAKIQAQMDEARKRARFMEAEIDDHLREARYAAQCRDVIDDGCKIGTGIMKGPVIGDKSRRSWQHVEVTDDSGRGTGEFIYEMVDVEDKRPQIWRVDPWNFFPDMDARNIEDGEGDYERHLLNPKQLRRLARSPGFDQNAIRRVLTLGPDSSTPTYLADLRSITGQYHDATTNRFHVWEHHGPLSRDSLRDLATIMGMDESMRDRAAGILSDLEEYEGDIDPLVEIEAVIWFCQGEILKFGLHFLDSGDPIYSVFNLEKDDSCIFGFGIPYIMRDPQSAMASAWRALMDNAGLSSGPQVVIDEELVEPVNGVWALEPRKIWRKKGTADKNAKPFEAYHIPSNLEQLQSLIELCKTNVDEETSMPMLAQGEQGAQSTKTAHGMSLLMNSANVVFRRIVKNWDDDMTVPTIRRLYDFLMQFSEKEHIKGDYEVDARGSSVLLVREMQSTNLLLFLMNFAGHEILGRFLKEDGLPALRALVRTMMLPADELVKSDDDIKKDEAEAAKAPPVPDPEMEKIAAQRDIAREDNERAVEIAYINRETALIQLAGANNMKLEELRAKLDDSRAERESKERLFAAEAAVQAQDADAGGGGYL